MSTAPTDNPGRLLRDLRRLVALHRDFGIETYPRTPELDHFLETPPLAPAAAGKKPAAVVPAAKVPPPPAATAPSGPSPARVAQTLAEIEAELGDCRRCPLHETRQQLVFGAGNPQATLFIVGDCPTSGDEPTATPFSGEAGALLARMLKAIGLAFNDVYLATIVKCRTNDHEPPQAERIKTCLPFLLRQIDAVAPKVICAMGPLAAQTLLKSKAPLSRLRGSFHDFHGIPLMPTFHPAFLIKNADMKKATWIDLQLIQAKLGLGKSGP